MKKKTQAIILALLSLSLLFPSIAKAAVSTVPAPVAADTETISRLPRKPIDPICIVLYEICVNFTRNRSCDACLARCRAQNGNWPFEICPIPARPGVSSVDKQNLKGCQSIDAAIQAE